MSITEAQNGMAYKDNDVVEYPSEGRGGLTLARDDLDDVLRETGNLEGRAGYAILLGPPGTGKTRSAAAAARPEQRVIMTTMHVEGTAVDFTGHKEIQHGNTVYWEGLGLQAWRSGALLVINEVDNASEDVLQYLYQLLDDPLVASMQLPSGEVVRPAPGFRVIATTNGRPEDLPDAIRDRFGLWLRFDEPSRPMYERLDADVADVMRRIYAKAATATTARERVPYVTYRQADAFCELRRNGIMRNILDVAAVAMEGDVVRAERFVTALGPPAGGRMPMAPPSVLLERDL